MTTSTREEVSFSWLRFSRPAAMDKPITRCAPPERDECYEFALRVARCALPYEWRIALVRGDKRPPAS